jgi:glycosyltransferase involved in cell wall biosynthesis
VHEDVPKQTLSKDYVKPVFRKFLAFSIGFVEMFISSRLSSIITVTGSINQRFSKWNEKCVIINNYPILENMFSLPVLKRNGICYIGNISSIRGIEIILDSLLITDTILHLAGEFETEDLRNKLFAHPAWTKVKYYGIVGLIKAREIMGSSAAGLVTYLPLPNHLEAQPNKMFEYMSCGTPVIASDFPLWKDIIEKNGCGLCINPMDHEEIANAFMTILKDPGKAGEMGLNGQNMVRNKYNWETEGLKLKNLYADLLQ